MLILGMGMIPLTTVFSMVPGIECTLKSFLSLYRAVLTVRNLDRPGGSCNLVTGKDLVRTMTRMGFSTLKDSVLDAGI